MTVDPPVTGSDKGTYSVYLYYLRMGDNALYRVALDTTKSLDDGWSRAVAVGNYTTSSPTATGLAVVPYLDKKQQGIVYAIDSSSGTYQPVVDDLEVMS